VEVNTPLFNKNALHKLMNHLDYNLIGWGIDYLAIWCNGIDKKKDYAIVHSIGCINPFDHNKKEKKRELERIENCKKRATIWKNYAKQIGCPAYYHKKEYSSVSLLNATNPKSIEIP
jgi:hypothetical protein